jgi:hypothetical protein
MTSSSHLKPYSLKEGAITLQHKATPDGLYVQDILATFGTRSQAVFVLFFTLPFIQPVPLLGLSTPIGFVLMILGFLIMLNKPLWLPQKVLRRHLPAKIVVSSCKFLIQILTKTEKLIKPRLSGLTNHRLVQTINGLLIIIFAFLLALPLPIPFSNTIPAWFLVLNALGELEEDGILMWLSYVVAISGFIFFVGLGAGIEQTYTWALQKYF